MKTWSAEELGKFLAEVQDDRLYPLWLVVASTGMRRGEALGGYWTDLDLGAARWQVRHTLVAVGHELRDSTPKTDHGRRSVALDSGTVRVLREWRRRQLEERLAWGPAWTDTGRVFSREDGADLHPERVSERFDRLVQGSGLPRLTVHGLRHTRHDGATGRRPSEGGPGAARPLVGCVHPGQVLACDSRYAGGRRADGGAAGGD